MSTRTPRRCFFVSLAVFVSAALWQCESRATDVIVNVAGTTAVGYSGDGGPATSAQLNLPIGIAKDSSGNIYVCDYGNHCVRRIDAATNIISTIAGTGTAGFSGDGGPATSAQLNSPGAVAIDSSGNLYISDWAENRVRKVAAADGTISTIAGDGSMTYGGDGGLAVNAGTRGTASVAIDPIAGSLVFSELNTSAIRRVDLSTNIITTICGNGSNGYNGDGILAINALITDPEGVCFDAAGNLFFIDSFNERVRMITRATGIISTVAGTGQTGFSGDNGPASAATFQFNNGSTALGYLSLDPNGNIYVTDGFNQRIRYIDHATGIITTIAGNGSAGYDGNVVEAQTTRLNLPKGILVESNGDYLFADSSNSLLRRVERNSTLLPSLTGIASDAAIVQGTSATFTATASDPAGRTLTYSWVYGDGSAPATGNPVTHTFASAGTFTVTCTVSNGVGTVSGSVSLTVVGPNSGADGVKNVAEGKPPVANPLNSITIAVAASNGGAVELDVNVDALLRDAFDVSTDFDGLPGRIASAPGRHPVQKFADPSVFVATSTAFDTGTTNERGKARRMLAFSNAEVGQPVAYTKEPASRTSASRASKASLASARHRWPRAISSRSARWWNSRKGWACPRDSTWRWVSAISLTM